MNQGQGNIGLQAAMARLVTTPAVALELLRTRDTREAGLALSPEDDAQLLRFLDEYGTNFKISVLLLKKRRLDGVIASYGVIPKLYSEYELSCFWGDYLSSIRIDDIVEKNPISESIRFGEFLLQQLAPSDVHRDLVVYDVLRNRVVAACGADDADYGSARMSDDAAKRADAAAVAPFAHPALGVGSFATNVSASVRMLNEGAERSQVLSACVRSGEAIVFYKNWRLGGVGTLKANPAMAALAGRMTGGVSIATLASVIGSAGLPAEQRMRGLLETLSKTGVIIYLPHDECKDAGYVRQV